MASAKTIYVVDDDPSTCALIMAMIEHLPYERKSFASVEGFLLALPSEPSGCIILDVRLPGKSGLDLQRDLLERGLHLPLIFVTGYGDVLMAVRSMRMGAVDFIEKPFRPQHLLDSVQRAMVEATRLEGEQSRRGELEVKFAKLTERELLVVKLVAEGLTNKAVAAKLEVSPQAIDGRRINAMGKLGVASVAELIQLLIEFQRGSAKMGNGERALP